MTRFRCNSCEETFETEDEYHPPRCPLCEATFCGPECCGWEFTCSEIEE